MSTAATPADSFRELDEAAPSPYLWKVLVVSGMGFFTDAYDLFIIGVAVAILKKQWHLTSFDTALLNSTTLIASAIGAIAFGRVADLLGRKRIYGFEVLVLALGALASAAAPSIGWLVAFRFILGLGIGGDYPVSATIMSEYAGKKTRGMMVGLVFGMQGAGLVIGPILASILLSTSLDHDAVWRILLGLGAVPGLAVYYLRRRIKETPRWTALKTSKSGVSGNDSSDQDQLRTALTGYGDLVHNPRLRKWLIGASAAWFLLDFAYYGNTISSPAVISAIDAKASLLHQTLTQLAIFVIFAVPGYALAAWLLDRLGRKTIQIEGFIMMALVFGSIGFVPGATAQVMPFVILFGLSYFFTEFGPNTTTFVYPAEIFPVHLRTTAHGVAAAMGKVGAFVGAFLFPYMLSGWSLSGAEKVVAAVSLAGLAVTILCLPEPKGRSLEEMSKAGQEQDHAMKWTEAASR